VEVKINESEEQRVQQQERICELQNELKELQTQYNEMKRSIKLTAKLQMKQQIFELQKNYA
jgi:hypothetical protein